MIDINKAEELHKQTSELLRNEQISDALTSMKQLALEAYNWDLRSEFEMIESNYRRMLMCMLQDMIDPERNHMYMDLQQKALILNDRLYRAVNRQISNTLYYRTIREVSKKTAFYSLSSFIEWAEEQLSLPDKQEELTNGVFNVLWTSDIWTSNDRECIRQLLDPNIFPEHLAALAVSAVTLALNEMYDPQKLQFLMDAYAHPSPSVSLRAITGIVIGCIIHDNRLMHSPEVHSHLIFLAEETHFEKDLQNIQHQLLQSRETEKINKFMHEELIPEMLKNPLLKKDKTGLDSINIENSLNPEWEKWSESKSVKKKINQMNELYSKGADIHMASFSNMKNFPFFHIISNWFLPFNPHHPVIMPHPQDNGSQSLQDIWIKTITCGEFCDSDKYSICLLLSSLPGGETHQHLTQQMASFNDEIEEHIDEMRAIQNKRENISKKYIQDLYRFFKLFSRKHEFNDIFKEELNLLYCTTLETFVYTPENIREVASTLFNLKHYEEAISMFSALEDLQELSFNERQQYGFCLQQTKQYAEAIQEYEKADLMQTDNLWNTTHLAQCYTLESQFTKAVEYYKKAEQIAPDDLQIQLQTGNLLAKLGEYEEAFKRFFKVHYLDEQSVVVWRAIAWYSLLANKMEQAERFYHMIEARRETASNETDLLNIGHFHWKNNKYSEAVSYYQRCSNLVGEENFKEMLLADADDLIMMQISPLDIPLIIDLIKIK
ncbi:MAG: tetratricopeptide repeat protein [Bacteroidaceae bacterium]|nr:tetratricopeptide repeat protein [Bacteroidaceae bacterium]